MKSLFNALQNSILIIAIVLISILLVTFLIIAIRKIYVKKKYKNAFASKVYQVALYGDYYLINDFTLMVESNRGRALNHILFGDKYVYVIMSKWFDGSLKGVESDVSLFLVNKNGQTSFIDNPLINTKNLIKKLCINMDIPSSMVVGITIVNKECSIDVKQDDKYNYLIPVNKLESLIAAIEKRKVNKIKEDELKNLVIAFDKANKKFRRVGKKQK